MDKDDISAKQRAQKSLKEDIGHRKLSDVSESATLKSLREMTEMSPFEKAIKKTQNPSIRHLNQMMQNPSIGKLNQMMQDCSIGQLNQIMQNCSIGQAVKAMEDSISSLRSISKKFPFTEEFHKAMTPIEGLLETLNKNPTIQTFEALRVATLGKKGSISALMSGLGAMSPDERKAAGAQLNLVKDEVVSAITATKTALEAKALEAKLAEERVDVTLPCRPETLGRVHPTTQVMDEIMAIFGAMGFTVAEGPDIEDDFHNFTALNIPAEHPARQMHDTFYFDEREDGARHLLRTHTSPVQVRTMMSHKPPIRIIAPGRTYRCDSDMTHTPMFHQVEGLVIDLESNMSHLKGVLTEFVQSFFEVDHVPVRFRPSFFPFTEPSAEVDIGCSRSGGELKIGDGGDWLEILGCGMVHPNVLRACGIDPDVYQGFAFGMGIERLAMLKYGIPDLRTFFDCDLRWLKHYGFVPLDVPTLSGGLTR